MKTRQNPFVQSIALAASVVVSLASANAANLTWDANTGTTGAQDGSGTWTTGAGGWWNGTANVNWANGDTATFGIGSGTAGNHTITLGSDIGLGAVTVVTTVLNFASPGNYTLSANTARTVNLSNSGTQIANIVLSSGVVATIGDNVKLTRSNDGALRGQLSLYGGATSGTTNGGTLIVGTGIEGSNSVLENLSTGNLVEIRQGLTLEARLGGTFSSNSSMVVGSASSTATENNHTNNLKITGGTVNVGLSTGGNLVIGNNGNLAHTSNSIVTITAGSLNVNSTAANTGLRFGSTVSNASYVANGTVHLDGGVITVGRIFEGTATGSAAINSTFNFNGGELKVLSGTNNAATFMTGLNTAQVRNGGAKIHTNGVDTIIGQALIHSTIGGDNATDGGLEKRGTGSLTLNGVSTYTGATTISQGSLVIGASGSIANSSTIHVGTGATLDVSAAPTTFTVASGQALTGSGLVNGNIKVDGTLSIGSSPGTLTFDDNLILSGTSNFEFTLASFAAGSYDLARSAEINRGSVTFGGVLNLNFDSATTYTNSSVQIFNFGGGYSGSFSTVNVSGLGTGQTATFNPLNGVVTVVPEPSAALLGGLGLLALVRRRRH